MRSEELILVCSLYKLALCKLSALRVVWSSRHKQSISRDLDFLHQRTNLVSLDYTSFLYTGPAGHSTFPGRPEFFYA